MHAVERVRTTHEVGWALGGATNTGELHQALRLDAHLVKSVDDALRDGIVAATGTKRRFAAAVVENLKTDPVRFDGWLGCFDRNRGSGRRCHLDSFLRDEVIGYGPRVDRQPVEVSYTAQLHDVFRLQIQLEQTQHLRITVLLDHIDPSVLNNKLMHFARERISAQPQVIRVETIFLNQLVAALARSKV